MKDNPTGDPSPQQPPQYHIYAGRYFRRHYEYRSTSTICGIPLVHVAVGINPETGRPSIAKGIIAVGDGAIGGLAIGGGAIGVVALGGGAIGVFALGGGALATMVAFGGGAISTGVALGGGAIGLLAAAGGAAIGFIAFGGAAVGHYAYGGGAAGTHAWDAVRKDKQAVDALQNLSFEIPPWLPFIPLATTLFLVMLITMGLRLAYAKQENTEVTDEWNPNRVFEPKPSSGCLPLLLVLLIVPALAALLAALVFAR